MPEKREDLDTIATLWSIFLRARDKFPKGVSIDGLDVASMLELMPAPAVVKPASCGKTDSLAGTLAAVSK